MRPPRVFPARPLSVRPLPFLVIAALALSGACGSDDDSETSDSAATTSATSGSATSGSAASGSPTSGSPTSGSPTSSVPPSSVTVAGESVPVARLTGYAAAICEAARQAATDFDAARRTFNGRAHDGLHLIARGLETVDRAAAASLLEAKQKVEADLSKPPPADQLVADLNRLADVTRSGLARFEVTADACPPA